MDIDQSARRQARDEFQVIDPDYYDVEGKLDLPLCTQSTVRLRHPVLSLSLMDSSTRLLR